MSEITVHDVAAYLVAHSSERLQSMKLQKLAYFSQGWHLAWLNVPLFNEKIYAWKMGPVVRDLFRNHKGAVFIDEWATAGADSSKITGPSAQAIDRVIKAYRDYSGFDMGEESHRHKPWIDHFVNVPDHLRGSQEMPVAEIKAQFDALRVAMEKQYEASVALQRAYGGTPAVQYQRNLY